MSREFYIRILKPVPKKFYEDKVFEDTEISAAGLDTVYYEGLSDRYHVPVKSRSVYASMDDVKRYLKTVMPDTHINNWGMRHGYGSTHCFGEGWTYDIPDSIMETLKRPHIADTRVILCSNSWSVEDYDAEWLGRMCPMYITKKSINNALVAYLAHLREEEEETLSWEVTREEMYSGNVFNSMCAAYVYAEKVGGIGYIEWE